MIGKVLVAQAGSLAWRTRAPDDAPVTFGDASAASAWLRGRSRGLGALPAIRRAASELGRLGRIDALTHDEAIDRLARALSRGVVAAAVALEPFAIPHEEEQEAEPPPVAPETALTWIAIQLLDDGDPQKPIPGETYELTLPDGSVRRGSLDAQGYALVEGIDPGSCQVSFPNLDARDWKPA